MPRARVTVTSLIARFCLLLSCPTSAVVDHLRGNRVKQPTHYLSFGILGDLTNQWECIVNAAMLAAKMSKTQPMALVLPKFPRTATGRFGDVYDMELFREDMKKLGVDVVESVPDDVSEVSLSTVEGKDLNHDVASWLPTMQKHKDQNVHYTIDGGPNLSWESNEARQLAKCKEKYDLCGPIFESLQYTPQIKTMSSRIVEQLNKGGDWLAVHLHDFQAFLCHHDRDAELKIIKERIAHHSLKPKQLYIVGAFGDLQHISDIIGMEGVSIMNKQSVLGADAENLQFQESAAVDQGVVREAASYLTKPGSSFDELANNIRSMSGKGAKTYKLPQIGRDCESEEEAAAQKKNEAAAAHTPADESQ